MCLVAVIFFFIEFWQVSSDLKREEPCSPSFLHKSSDFKFLEVSKISK